MKKEDEATKLARQKKFYRAQRVNAEETGNQPMVDKIYGKLGRPSHSVDADAVNKGILGAVATPAIAAAAPEAGAAGAVGAGLARMGGGAMAGQAMQQGPKIVGAALHPIDHALAVLEQKLPGVTAKIEHAIGSHHEELGGTSPFKSYGGQKSLSSTPQKALPGGVQKGAKTHDIDYRGKEMAPRSARSSPAKNPKEQGMMNDIDYIRNKQINNARRASTASKKESTAPAAGRKGSQTSATPKQKGQTAAPKEQQAPKTGVKSGHKPTVGARQAKPGASPGKTSAAPKKAPQRTSAAAKANPYSKEGIAAARGSVPKNNVVKRKKDA